MLVKIYKQKNQYNKNSKILFIKDRPGHDQRYALNSSKLRNKLNWSPKVNIKKGLESTFEWYKK